MQKNLQIIGEMVSVMRVIKYFCLEKYFEDIIGEVRNKQMKFMWYDFIYRPYLSNLNIL